MAGRNSGFRSAWRRSGLSLAKTSRAVRRTPRQVRRYLTEASAAPEEAVAEVTQLADARVPKQAGLPPMKKWQRGRDRHVQHCRKGIP